MSMNEKERAIVLKNEGKTAAKYFEEKAKVGGFAGCFATQITDELYDFVVSKIVEKWNVKDLALKKLGLSENTVGLMKEQHIEFYAFPENGNYGRKKGNDGKWRSAIYESIYIYYSGKEVYAYSITKALVRNTSFDTEEESVVIPYNEKDPFFTKPVFKTIYTKYLFNAKSKRCGCNGITLTDEAFDTIVIHDYERLNLKQRALEKIGVDESQVKEIEPVKFAWYSLMKNGKFRDFKEIGLHQGDDGVWRTGVFEVTWLFFSDAQIFTYKYEFHLSESRRNEITQEYFFKDVTNFTSFSEDEEFPKEKSKDSDDESDGKSNRITSESFKIVVPGEVFLCSMRNDEFANQRIMAMKAKLREKKG